MYKILNWFNQLFGGYVKDTLGYRFFIYVYENDDTYKIEILDINHHDCEKLTNTLNELGLDIQKIIHVNRIVNGDDIDILEIYLTKDQYYKFFSYLRILYN